MYRVFLGQQFDFPRPSDLRIKARFSETPRLTYKCTVLPFLKRNMYAKCGDNNRLMTNQSNSRPRHRRTSGSRRRPHRRRFALSQIQGAFFDPVRRKMGRQGRMRMPPLFIAPLEELSILWVLLAKSTLAPITEVNGPLLTFETHCDRTVPNSH